MKHLALLALLALSIPAQACYEYDCDGVSLPMKKVEGGYQSKGGAVYKYDLSRELDRSRYERDVGAQLRDQRDRMYERPYRDTMEDAFNQRGGGIK